MTGFGIRVGVGVTIDSVCSEGVGIIGSFEIGVDGTSEDGIG